MLRPSTLGGPSQPSCLREGSAGGGGETGCDKNNISSGFLLFSIFFPSAGMRVLWMGGRREEKAKKEGRGGDGPEQWCGGGGGGGKEVFFLFSDQRSLPRYMMGVPGKREIKLCETTENL